MDNAETLCNLEALFGHLSAKRSAELSAPIYSYPGMFGNTPSPTYLIEHDIDVGDAQPIRQRFYHASEEKRKVMDKEI